MEALFTFIFTKLSLEDKVSIRRLFRAGRAQVLEKSLDAFESEECRSRLGSWAPSVNQFFKAMISVRRSYPDLFWRIIDHWSVAFLLSRTLLSSRPAPPDQIGQLCSNLNGMLLLERLLKGAAFEPNVYRVMLSPEGRLYSFFHGVALEFTDARLRGQALVWNFEDGKVKVRSEGLPEEEFVLSVPLAEDPHVRTVPVGIDGFQNVPVLDEKSLMGPLGVSRAPDPDVVETRDPHWHPLPLVDSLSHARQVITRLMPEAIDWLDVFIPAFIDLGNPHSQVIRASGSYEPGSPIFLSRVAQPLHHAEDLVHEVQHHRLHLVGSEEHFKSWKDLRSVFVSPYRADRRPLRGLLIGIHAFITVNELQRRMLNEGSAPAGTAEEMAETHYKNLFALRTLLQHERFSESGSQIMAQMAAVMCEHHREVQRLAHPASGEKWRQKLMSHIQSVGGPGTDMLNSSPDYLDWDDTIRLAASYAERGNRVQVTA